MKLNTLENPISIIDYSNSITNVTSSIERFYSKRFNTIEVHYDTNKTIDYYLDKKQYKNVVVILFDAMGRSIMEKNLGPKSFLRKNMISTTLSTYPPTTANCTTAWRTGLNPISTGWLGWSTYYKSENVTIDNFPNFISGTREKYHKDGLSYILTPIKDMGKTIEEASNGSIRYSEVHCPLGGIGSKNLRTFAKDIVSTLNENDENYIYAYWNNPDYIMHEKGTKNLSVWFNLKKIERCIKYIEKNVKDTLVIISADHSQIDVEPINLYEYEDIMELIEHIPSCDSRTPFFFVKEENRDKFKTLFNKYFSEFYYLMEKEEVLNNDVFGVGEKNPLIDSMVGDFVGFAISNKYIRKKENDHYFKGHHAGLTIEEMEIPLIIINK